ncbi:MAG: zf-TFIIB domain-containing protein [Gammaproteobacteria bacterium]|jgi:Zn-finger nucleic acid-binding protein
MKCPACHDPLYRKIISDIELDICLDGCGGIWFDQFEFKKFDEPHEFTEEVLELETQANKEVDHIERRECARCEKQLMLRRFYSPKQQIEIDECAMCGGIWLDYGELGRIRNQYDSYEDLQAHTKEFMNKEFGEEVNKVYEEWAEETASYNRFANMFKFLYPSWWISGKQDWGNF